MRRKPVVVRPGEEVPDSGIYEARDPYTSEVLGRATMVKGDPAPPTPEHGVAWVQVVDTNPDDASSEALRDG